MWNRLAEALPRPARFLWREPAFSAHAILILALGIGATSAVFSLVQGTLLAPPPYSEPERIVLVTPKNGDSPGVAQLGGWPVDQWQEWQRSAKSLDAVAAYGWGFAFLVLEGGSESEEGMLVTPQYFEVTGLRAALGRTFVDDDTAGERTSTIILGHDLWERQFHSDPEIVGKTIHLSRDMPRTVIGVMPAGIRFLPTPGVAGEPNYNPNAKVDYWLPLPREIPQPRRAFTWLSIVGRLRPGATPSDAQAELAVITARLAQDTPALAAVKAEVEPLTNVLNADGRRILLPLLAAAGLVLLISCGNAAALLLVRGLQRRHEYGVRGAIGANRAALFKQAIADCLLLATVGGVVGIGLGAAIVELFKRVGGHAIPRLDAVSIGWPIVTFGVAASLVACALAGAFPAWRASRMDPIEALRDTTAKSTSGRGQNTVLAAVLVAQMALTLALLVGAGLLTRTMSNLGAVRAGFDTHGVVTMSVTAVDGTGDDWADFHERALERVAAIPGVERVAFAWGVPLTGNSWPDLIEVEGYTSPDRSDGKVPIAMRAITPGYFALIGQRIEEGRDFLATDRQPPQPANQNGAANAGVPPDLKLVAIVNRAFVDRYFGGAAAVGKKLFTQYGPTRVPMDVIGVVSNSRTDDLSHAPEPEIYGSLWQNRAYSKHLVVRTTTDPAIVAAEVRRELHALQPTAAVENVQTLDGIRDDSLASRTFAMRLLVGFAVVASVLTLAGVYSVLSLSVATRKREIAIRSAVGAVRGRIVGLILRDGARLIVAGLVAGLVISFALSRVLQSMLFGVSRADPATLVGAALAFALVALLACYVPAARAARINPADALKGD
jgi:putative ABC transport system permease protein